MEYTPEILAMALADTDASDQSQGRDWGGDGMNSSALDLGVELGWGRGFWAPQGSCFENNKDQMNAANHADVQCVQ